MPLRDTVHPFAQSQTLILIGSIALAMGGYALIPIAKEFSPYKDFGDTPSDLHAALSLVLGWLLVFRTNAAYSRWWEARTLWGNLINCSRNASVKFREIFPELDETERTFLSTRLSEFPRALTCHLRRESYSSNEIETCSIGDHIPLRIIQDLYGWLINKQRQGLLEREQLRILDVELSRFLDVCGGCERIARTPIVKSYRFFARQCILLFLLTLPWGLVRDFMWWTIPLTVVVSYFMVGMEIVAEHVEEPFGYDDDDLDLGGMTETIQLSVSQVFNSRGSDGHRLPV